MADRRYDDQRRVRDDRPRDRDVRRDPDTERRLQRRADRYRGSDERGYGGGERLGRDWERGSPRGEERFGRESEYIRSDDEERFDRGAPERFRRERDERGYGDIDRGERRFRDVSERRSRALDRGGRGASPSGAFYDELREERERPRRYGDRTRPTSLMPEREERHRERRRQRDYQPRHGHGPGRENMEPPLLGYGTSPTRSDDHELGHGGFLGGGTYRMGSPQPTGRAPRGYQRSDDRIREDICDRLMMSWMNAENADIQVSNGEVTLTGTVKTRDEKRAIEALADCVPGVKEVHNALRLERGEPPRAEPRPDQRGEQLPLARAQGPRQPQEQRAQGQEQTSAQPPGGPLLHS